MSKRTGLFTVVWLALWTLGAFVGLTQLWMLPEGAPFSQIAVLAGVLILCALAWLATAWRLFRTIASPGSSSADDRS